LKNRISISIRLPRRLYKVITDIRPLFVDWEEIDPMRGALTRALEYIIQYYMQSEDYDEKVKHSRESIKRLFDYLKDKDKELIKESIS